MRGDRTLWLDPNSAEAAHRSLAEAMETLRLALNEGLQLGLFSFEAHYALYPPGASYRRHRDAFHDAGATADARVISCALYLNSGWAPEDGGALRIHDGIYGDQRAHDVLPVSGTLACFLSQRFEHEVLPAKRDRLAVTGWFRRRA